MPNNHLTFNIIASFTSDGLVFPFKYLVEKLGYTVTINKAPYNQVFQQLLNPLSLIYTMPDAYNFVLIRVEDWFKYKASNSNAEQFTSTVNYFISVLKAATMKGAAPIILGYLPSGNSSVREQSIAAKEKIELAAAHLSNVHFVDLTALEGHYQIKEKYDNSRDKLAHIPFGQEYLLAIAFALCRSIYQRIASPFKVIAIDCDNTLWQGICGEDGFQHVRISSHFINLQQKLIQLQQAGMLICLCSKNNEKDVWDVFNYHSGMELRPEHIVAHKINWDRKSTNLLSLASELNVGLDSFIFIDDNPLECAEVSATLPSVLVINAQDMMMSELCLKHHWALDVRLTTAEDSQRTKHYFQNRERDKLRHNTLDYEIFLEKLQLNIDIQPLTEMQISRAAQLTQRTNQFNSTTIRRDVSQISSLMQSSGWLILRVIVNDYFGDYGFVGLVIVNFKDSLLICESFMLSCRILGRRVEHAIMRYLVQLAKSHGLQSIHLKYSPSEKNLAIQSFFQTLSQDPLAGDIIVPIDEVEHWLNKPTTYSSVVAQHSIPQFVTEVTIQHSALNLFATWGGNMDRFAAAMQADTGLPQSRTTEYQKPITPWQKKVAYLFAEILNIDKAGNNDNFYDLGGNDMQHKLLQERLSQYGIPESVSLKTISEPTVVALAKSIEEFKQAQHV